MHPYALSNLRNNGYRITPQRWLIYSILHGSGQHLTPLEIIRLAEAEMPGITEATVYRTLNFLTEHDLVLAAHVGNGQLVYEVAHHAHHHLICRSCGQSHEIDHEILAALYEDFEQRTGYHIDSLHTTFFGLCPDCQGSIGQ